MLIKLFYCNRHIFYEFSFHSEWDGDGDGCVDFKEFLHVVSRMLTENVTENFERMKEAFRLFDKVKLRYENCILWYIKREKILVE